MTELDFNTTDLTMEELTAINGGESGWYYLGRAAGYVRDEWKSLMHEIRNSGGSCC